MAQTVEELQTLLKDAMNLSSLEVLENKTKELQNLLKEMIFEVLEKEQVIELNKFCSLLEEQMLGVIGSKNKILETIKQYMYDGKISSLYITNRDEVKQYFIFPANYQVALAHTNKCF
jgi:hypothetical protein